MNTDERFSNYRPTRTFRFFKWSLFAVEIFLLWVLCNTLFLVPGPYAGARGIIIALSAVLSVVVAWASGRMFQGISIGGSSSIGKIISTPPAVICIFVLAVAAVIMVAAILANR